MKSNLETLDHYSTCHQFLVKAAKMSFTQIKRCRMVILRDNQCFPNRLDRCHCWKESRNIDNQKFITMMFYLYLSRFMVASQFLTKFSIARDRIREWDSEIPRGLASKAFQNCKTCKHKHTHIHKGNIDP